MPTGAPQPQPSSPPPAGGLAKVYQPLETESRITARWDAAGAFHADPSRVLRGEAHSYCILIPPPNVTAALHLGHALNNTLQDVLIRAHRMMEFETLWMPGTDHAGIATQAVVEKRLRKEGMLKGALKESMRRDEFVAHVQAFKDEYEATITAQLKEMGCSCDWARQRFTMDDQCAAAVREAFFRLFKDGLIYRGKRLVNWDPALQTAVADDECYDEDVATSFWYLRYPLCLVSPSLREGAGGGLHSASDSASTDLPRSDPVTWSDLAQRGYPGAADHPRDQSAFITVATTRPETYLGDTAVAINPRDPRAAALRGLSVRLPLVGRVIPIVEDDYVVMPSTRPALAAQSGGDIGRDADATEEPEDPKAKYATGFLKVTPAHDQNDAEIGQRHNLPAINMMSPDGRVSDQHGWTDVGEAGIFVGLKMAEARKKVVEAFESRGLLAEVRPYSHNVKHSDRSKAIVEPYLSDQWYVKVTDERLVGGAQAALVPDQSSVPSRGPGLRPGGERSVSASPTDRGRHLRRMGASAGAPALRAAGPEVRPTGTSPTHGSTLPVGHTLNIYTRHLPHFQQGGSSYFITFRVKDGTLTPAERQMALDACLHWHEERMTVHAAVVMPDHVHLVIYPLLKAPDQWHTLGELMHSIKSFSAHQIAKLRGREGLGVWQDEWYDRIVRASEIDATVDYVLRNPERAGLVAPGQAYPFGKIPRRSPGSKDAPYGLTVLREKGPGYQALAHPAAGPEARPTAENATNERSRGPGLRPGGERSVSTSPADTSGHPGSDTGPEARPTRSSGDGEFRFHPPRYAKTYSHWHEHIRDWCISRQLWWGHRIPVWSLSPRETFPPSDPDMGSDSYEDFASMVCGLCYDIANSGEDPSVYSKWDSIKQTTYVCARDSNAESALSFVAAWLERGADPTELNSLLESAGARASATKLAALVTGMQRDPDVLDTWFSSALWPISTMGWPDPAAFNPVTNKGLLEAFNPTSVLCTAREIITLWVSRMVMFNRYFIGPNTPPPDSSLSDESSSPAGGGGGGFGCGPVPFRDVFIHAMIQDGQGRKMSKSLGNGVDPRDIIESHGADAMRFTLVQMTTNTQDVRMPVQKDSRTGKNTSGKFDNGRNFCNKLWNTTRFVLEKLGKQASGTGPQAPVRHEELSLLDRWMLSRLAATVKSVNASLAAYEFGDYAESLYKVLWWDLCDWYLEGIKPTVEQSPIQQAVLAHALETIVRLLHPIAPFITEAIWEHLKDLKAAPIIGITLDPSRTGDLLCTAGWPEVDESWIDAEAEAEFERLRELVNAIRNVRAEKQIVPKRKIMLHASAATIDRLNRVPGMVETLCGLERVEILSSAKTSPSPNPVPQGGAGAPLRIWDEEMFLSNLADEAAAANSGAESNKLAKQLTELRAKETAIAARLANPGYAERAPAKLVEESKAQLAKLRAEIAALESSIKGGG